MSKKYVTDNIDVSTVASIGLTGGTARVHIKGETSDDSAYALKIDNSSDTDLFNVRNDGVIRNLGKNIVANNEIIVNTVNDLPTPTDTGDGLGLAHRLESNKKYKIGNTIVLLYPIVPNNNTIYSDLGIALVYAGSGAFIRGNGTTQIGITQFDRVIITSATGTNSAFSITDSGTLSIDYLIVKDINPGIVDNADRVYIRNSIFENPKSTFTLADLDVVYWQGVFLAENAPIGDAFVTLTDNIGVASFQNVEAQPILGDSFINIDSATFTGKVQLSYVETRLVYGGIFFKAGSLDQTDPKVEARDCVPISDSQTIGSLYMERNTTITNPTIKGETGTITAFADAGGGQITVTSAGHGLSNGAVVWLLDDTYTGKYTISNVATDTFEITTTYSGTSTGTWETGWTKVAGTTYPMENERASMTGNNKITFANLEEQKVSIVVSTNPRNNLIAAAKDWEFAVMKNDVRVKGTLKYREMTDKAGEGAIVATESAISGDYFEVYTRNLSDTTTDMVMENMSTVIE